MVPNVLSTDEEGNEVVNYKILSHKNIIELVSHYISNALLPFFEPDSQEEISMTVMPLSEEFVE